MRLVWLVPWLISCVTSTLACTVFEGSHWGFSNNLNRLFLAAAFAEDPLAFYFDEERFPYRCSFTNNWANFFAGPVPKVFYPPPPNPRAWPARTLNSSCIRWDENDVLAITSGLPPDQVLPKMGAAARHIWQLNPPMAAAVEMQQRALLPQQQGGRVIAFHVRGGDKIFEDTSWGLPVADAVAIVEAAKRSRFDFDGATCLIVGDDPVLASQAAELAKQLKCSVLNLVPETHSGGHDQYSFIRKGLEERCYLTQRLVIDIDLLARADFFVGNFNSNVGRMVYVLRAYVYAKDQSTTVDVFNRPWRHQVQNGDRFEAMQPPATLT